MLSWLIRRVLMLIPVFLAVSVVIFSILHFIPGDPIDNLLKPGSSPTALARVVRPTARPENVLASVSKIRMSIQSRPSSSISKNSSA